MCNKVRVNTEMIETVADLIKALQQIKNAEEVFVYGPDGNYIQVVVSGEYHKAVQIQPLSDRDNHELGWGINGKVFDEATGTYVKPVGAECTCEFSSEGVRSGVCDIHESV